MLALSDADRACLDSRGVALQFQFAPLGVGTMLALDLAEQRLPPTTEHGILRRRRPSRLLAAAGRMSFVACTGAVTRPALAHAFLVSVHSIESIDLQGGYALRRDPRLAGVLPVCCPAQRIRCRERQQKMLICRHGAETGATGLEPATSGVTDHFSGRSVRNDAQASAPFMRFFGGLQVDSAWLRGAVRDVCCPSAARSTSRCLRRRSGRDDVGG